MSNKARLIKLERKQNNNGLRKNNWIVEVISSSRGIVERYSYPSREEIVNEY
jgi:hypothetical protein